MRFRAASLLLLCFLAAGAVAAGSPRPIVLGHLPVPAKHIAVFGQDVKFSGPIAANVWVSTTRNEAILSVRVADVHPDGSSEEMTFGLLAASFRAVNPMRSRFIHEFSVVGVSPRSSRSGFRCNVTADVPFSRLGSVNKE